MKNLLFSGLSSLLLPMGAYAGPTAGASYQRTYLSSSIKASTTNLSHTSALPRDLVDLSGDQLDIQVAHAIRELVIVDEGVAEADKAVLRRALKPGVEMVHIQSAAAGLPQLIAALEGHKNLAAIHVISHAEAGAILLGNSRITPENIQREVHAFAALHGAVREGGDLLFYGCDLAANEAGEDLLDIISNNTGLDVAASNNLTGNAALKGDWDLEVKRGNIESELAFSEKSLKDFSGVLVASDGTKTFSSGWTDNNSNLTSTDFIVTAKDNGGSAISDISIYSVAPNPAYIQTGYDGTTTGTYFHVAADGTNTGSFELTGLVAGEYGSGQFTNVHIVGIKPDNSTITSGTINGTGSANETFTFDATELASFSGVKLKAFKLVFDTTSGSGTKPFFEFRNFTIAGALAPLPVVTDARISISGASGSGGAYKIGDTVTATWNNTAGGDNNTDITGVTVDFSQFGGGAAVAATSSSDTWTATYTITSGAIDATGRNVSVTASNAAGGTTTADTTNATVDSIAPTVTDGRISISGASGTGGAYKIGDTVTATWNNTAGGDNNADTISSVTVNFSQFGGGAAVVASNSAGTWTATYTIVAGAIDATNRNVTVTATDNAGNATSTPDTTNATVDNIAPSVSSIVVSGSPGSGDTSMAFTANFSESVVNVSTDDFTLVGTGSASGTIASVSASAGSAINVNIASISGTGTLKVNLNGSTNVADDAGNSIAAYSGGSTHNVDILTAPDAPTIGTATAGDGQASVAFTPPADNGGSAITGYTVTSNPGGITATGSSSPITVTGLANGTSYTFTVTATNAVGTSTGSGASNAVTPKGNQTITFANPGSRDFGTTPTLTATSDSGLTVTFTSSTTGVCTITTGGALTFVTAGSCTINADQAGNGAWNAATQVSRTFTVNPVVPDAPAIGTATAGDTEATVTFSAPASSGGAAITSYTVTANPGGLTGTGTGSPLTVTGLTNGVSYTFTVTATNSAGTGDPSAASNSVTPAAPQTITFNNPGAQNFGTSPTLNATSDSGLTVTFTSATTGVCTVSSNTLTFVSTGTCTIDADQAGNAAYLPAPQVSQSFAVNPVVPGAPTTVIATAGDTQASVAFAAPAFTGGTSITGYTVTANPGGLTGTGVNSPIVVTGLTNGQAYTFTVTADNSAGTGPASSASNPVTPAASQTITFNNPGAQNFGTSPTLSATSDSGLTVTFTSSTTGVCTITSGGQLTLVTPGTCTINADQSGNASYLPAVQVSRSFTVNPVVPGAPVIGTATAGSAQALVAFTAPAFTGGAAITAYTVTANPGGATASGTASPIAVTGLTNGVAYTFTVTATNSAGTGVASGASNSVTPNGAPVIGGTPATSVMQDAAYSFTPTANDTPGDTLTFSITNKPAWASFNAATGALTGTPNNNDVGTTTGIVISVSDGSLGASLPAFNLTVSNVNDAPTITGTPATSVNQDATYSFTPTGADVDAGTTLVYSITNKPSWASFDTATGALTGTPTNADVGVTSGILISVSDGTLGASLPAFDLSVDNVNEAPTITGTPATSVAQDVAYSFIPTGADVDAGTTLVYSITNKPSWASFDTATGALTGTPTNADIGVTSGILISVSDGTLSASLPAFDLSVDNVNEAPTITGTPATSLDQDVAYSFTPVAADSDIGDVLTFSITNKPLWATFDTSTGSLTGTPAGTDTGVTLGIVISVSDGVETASLPAFDLEVIATVDPLQPIVTPPAELDVNAKALFTPINLRQLLGLGATASQAEVDQALKLLASDGVSGNDCCVVSAEGLIGDNMLLARPGRHLLTWKATNAAGITGEASQVINVHPLVSLSKSQVAIRGSSVEFRVLLNGPAPAYPLNIPYVIDVSSTATAQEHDLVEGNAVFTEPGQVEVVVPVNLPAVTGFSDSHLVVALGEGVNVGVNRKHVINIREGNVPPMVILGITQGGISTSLVTPTSGPVTVTAQVHDLNQGDTHSYDWSVTSGLADTDGNPTNALRTFDPTGLAGSHQVQVVVTDSAGASVQVSAYFRMVETLPTLDPDTDTDADGINDAEEGTGDTDDNGIPDYLDNMPSTNILPQQGNTSNAYLIECDPGVRCGLGLFARTSGSGGVQILDEELGAIPNLAVDEQFEPVGGVFDFAIRDLPTPGQTVRVVVPQRTAIPANATYRKFQKGHWISFVVDADNAIHSAAGNPGYCPPPGTDDWLPGLTAGHLCVQLTIKDGGPNDDDGLVNSAVVDPGAVSVEIETPEPPPPPPPPPPPVQIKSSGGGAVPAMWLFIMGALVMIRKTGFKRLLVVVALLSGTAQAVENRFYIRADLSSVTSSQGEEHFAAGLASANYDFQVDRYDENRSGYQVSIGYQYGGHFFTEIGYLDLGEVEVDMTLPGNTDMGGFTWHFGQHYPISAEGTTLVQGLTFNPDAAFKVSGEVGVYIWRSDVELVDDVFTLDRNDGEDPLVGVKFELPLGDKLGLGLGFRRIYFDTQETDLVSFTGSFYF